MQNLCRNFEKFRKISWKSKQCLLSWKNTQSLKIGAVFHVQQLMKIKRPVGRPSKYKPEYCELLIQHLSEGYSYESFAATIDVNEDTLREWEKHHPDFSASKKIGRQKQALFYQKLGISASKGQIENFNSTAFVWMTKNMLGWKDKQSIEHSGPNGGAIHTHNSHELISYTTDELIQSYLTLKNKSQQLGSKNEQD